MDGPDKRDEDKLRVVIVGAGPVGVLCALYFAKKNHPVMIFEKQQDPKEWREEGCRSINLTASPRGTEALKKVGVTIKGVPVDGRVVHQTDGSTKMTYYGTERQKLISVRRTEFNKHLIQEAERDKHIQFYFNHSFVSWKEGCAEFRVTKDGDEAPETVYFHGDLIIGADGAHSKVRQQMFNSKDIRYFRQNYHDHEYTELLVPATADGKHQLDATKLHVWPRRDLMLILLPNVDGTFSGTLFMPADKFKDILGCPTRLLDFFHTTFTDLVPLVGSEYLVQHFMGSGKTRPGYLVSNKVRPYHSKGRMVLVGDAAHAVVPFYGQGMNAGFEDCSFLHENLERFNYQKEHILEALLAYSDGRCKDGHAIHDLACQHYRELREDISGPLYYVRHMIGNVLHTILPNWWIPEYTMVAFRPDIPYHECVRRTEQQSQFIRTTSAAVLIGGVLTSLGCYVLMTSNVTWWF